MNEILIEVSQLTEKKDENCKHLEWMSQANKKEIQS